MKPHIHGTEFGKITVDNEVYEHDIVIRLGGKVKKRKKKLSKEALKAWNEAEGKTIGMFHVTC